MCSLKLIKRGDHYHLLLVKELNNKIVTTMMILYHKNHNGIKGMDKWLDGWMDGWMDKWMDEWMDGWIDGWMDGWINGWMNGWMDG